MTSGCVVHMPCESPASALSVRFFPTFANSSTESAIDTTWSSRRFAVPVASAPASLRACRYLCDLPGEAPTAMRIGC